MLAEVTASDLTSTGSPSAPVSYRIAVVGAGYVGLVTGSCLAQLGHRVTVVEVDARRLEALRAGFVPIREDDLDGIIERQVALGRLRFTDDGHGSFIDVDVVLVAVGTPSGADGRVDLSAVEAVVRQIARSTPEALVIIKSTVPPGTSTRMERLAHESGATGVRIVSNPEFLREGHAVHDFMLPARIVIGARREEDAAVVSQMYASLGALEHRCLPEEAELAKYASNSLLAARISFMNEVSAIADGVGADVDRVASIVGSDPRIGPAFLAAGLGWGGSCFPKDVMGLTSVGEDLGLATPMLRATMEANERQRQRALEIVLAAVEGRPSPCVAILGLAFKPHTDDVRESPSLWLASALVARGIPVRGTDPLALANAERAGLRFHAMLDPLAAVQGVDVTVLATEWPELVALDWGEVGRRMRAGGTVLDARNLLDARAILVAGLRYRSLGRDIQGSQIRGQEVACVS